MARGEGWRRVAGAGALALAVAVGAYLLLESSRPSSGLVGLGFLVVLPAAIGAFVATAADPFATRSFDAYLGAPLWALAAAVPVAMVLLREGALCILMLAPVWLVAGLLGASLAFWVGRRLPRSPRSRSHGLAVLALPLLVMEAEPALPIVESTRTVSRSVVVEAAPEAVWPLLLGIPDVRPGEGRWTVTHGLIGVPRPLGSRLLGEGSGAVRLSSWRGGIAFREVVTEWEPGRRIAWRFDLAGAAWGTTDRHLLPDGPIVNLTGAGYRLEPLGGGRTRVTLDTSHRMWTPATGYAALWGELLLGDLARNVLGVVEDRAEAAEAAG